MADKFEKATPRPWHVVEGETESLYVSTEDGSPVADCDIWGSSEANARLIVAAVNERDALREAVRIGQEAIRFAHEWVAGLPGTLPASFEDKRAAQVALEGSQARIHKLLEGGNG